MNETLTAVWLLILLVGVAFVRPSDDEQQVPEKVPADTLVVVPVNTTSTDYQQTIDMVDAFLQETYRERGVAYRPRNFLIDYVATMPSQVRVRVDYWLEDPGGLFQRCHASFLVDLTAEPAIDVWNHTCGE